MLFLTKYCQLLTWEAMISEFRITVKGALPFDIPGRKPGMRDNSLYKVHTSDVALPIDACRFPFMMLAEFSFSVFLWLLYTRTLPMKRR